MVAVVSAASGVGGGSPSRPGRGWQWAAATAAHQRSPFRGGSNLLILLLVHVIVYEHHVLANRFSTTNMHTQLDELAGS